MLSLMLPTVTRFQTLQQLPDPGVNTIQDFQNLPAELGQQLQSNLMKWQPDSTATNAAFGEVLDRRDKATREKEQDSVVKVTLSNVFTKKEKRCIQEN
jgi:hypothetical protein